MNKKVVTAIYSVALLGFGATFLDNVDTVFAKEDVVIEKDSLNYHVVQKGENLFRISLNNGLDADVVAKYNNIAEGSIIQPNDKIYFPSNKEKLTYVKKESKVGKLTENRMYGTNLLDWQYAILCAVVQQESVGYTQEELLPSDAYESALAVMTSITNRVDKDTYYGSDVYAVITAPNQYESFGANHYEKHLGNILDVTKQAVEDGLKGAKNHSYVNFRSESYAKAYGYHGDNIGGNVYFND